MHADLLIIDELDGRSEAKNQGIKIIGMLGVFKLAKERNIIGTIKPYLDKLMDTQFRLSPSLYEVALSDAGKFPPVNSPLKNKQDLVERLTVL